MTRDSIDFHRLLESVSRRLQARVDLSAVYAQPSGVGDDREYAVADVLREVLPERYAVDKGRVFDSEGHISAELDIIIYERDEVFLGLDVGGRRLIPIESVYGTIEVKSRLDKAGYASAAATLRSIEGLRRFYRWTDQLVHLTDENIAKVRAGVLATDRLMNIGLIWSSIVTFDAVADATLASYLVTAPDHLVFICVPGEQVVSKWLLEYEGYKGLRVGEKALGLYAWGLLELLTTNSRKLYFTPDLTHYRNRFVTALGSIASWDLKRDAATASPMDGPQ